MGKIKNGCQTAPKYESAAGAINPLRALTTRASSTALMLTSFRMPSATIRADTTEKFLRECSALESSTSEAKTLARAILVDQLPSMVSLLAPHRGDTAAPRPNTQVSTLMSPCSETGLNRSNLFFYFLLFLHLLKYNKNLISLV